MAISINDLYRQVEALNNELHKPTEVNSLKLDFDSQTFALYQMHPQCKEIIGRSDAKTISNKLDGMLLGIKLIKGSG